MKGERVGIGDGAEVLERTFSPAERTIAFKILITFYHSRLQYERLQSRLVIVIL